MSIITIKQAIQLFQTDEFFYDNPEIADKYGLVTYLDVDTYSASDVIVYPDSGNVRVLAGGLQKSFKLDSEVNYLDGE